MGRPRSELGACAAPPSHLGQVPSQVWLDYKVEHFWGDVRGKLPCAAVFLHTHEPALTDITKVRIKFLEACRCHRFTLILCEDLIAGYRTNHSQGGRDCAER